MNIRDVQNSLIWSNNSEYKLICCSCGQGTHKKIFSIQLIRETLAPATPIFCDSLYRQKVKNRIFSHDALILLHCNLVPLILTVGKHFV